MGNRELPVGFVLIAETTGSAGQGGVTWNAEEFYVPPGLTGSGITARLLDGLITYYRTHPGPGSATPIAELRVQFGGSPAKTRLLGPAGRYQRVRLIEFYKSRGFQYIAPEDRLTGAISLVLAL